MRLNKLIKIQLINFTSITTSFRGVHLTKYTSKIKSEMETKKMFSNLKTILNSISTFSCKHFMSIKEA